MFSFFGATCAHASTVPISDVVCFVSVAGRRLVGTRMFFLLRMRAIFCFFFVPRAFRFLFPTFIIFDDRNK